VLLLPLIGVWHLRRAGPREAEPAYFRARVMCEECGRGRAYVHTCTCIYIYIYIHTYMHTHTHIQSKAVMVATGQHHGKYSDACC
jgi:hypothetical protein